MMIVVFRPRGIPEADFRQYLYCWREMARVQEDAVIQRPWSDFSIQQEWDRVNDMPGRAVIWTAPHFIPKAGFFHELDYFLDEGILALGNQRYEALFYGGSDRPSQLAPSGVSPFPVIFQFAGQHAKKLPPSHSTSPSSYLSSSRSCTYLCEGQYLGDGTRGPVFRSVLGDTLCGLPSATFEAFGRLVTGGHPTAKRSDVFRYWRERLEAWQLYACHKMSRPWK